MINVELINYKGFEKSVRISNGKIELIALTQIGPRVIRYGFIDDQNCFCELENQLKGFNKDDWQIFGGHRLWHAPEASPRTTQPDNVPVDFELLDNGVVLIQPTEKGTGIKKKMTLIMKDDGSIEVNHELKNDGLWPVELAVWAITVMAPGGVEVVKNPDRETGLLSNRTLTLWPYTKLNDDRVNWGDKFIMLKQSNDCVSSFKFGFPNEYGFAAYFNNNSVFIKKHIHMPGQAYPDNNCSYETYTCNFMLEMETLSPLVTLQPGETEDHFERWELHGNVTAPKNEVEAESLLSKLL